MSANADRTREVLSFLASLGVGLEAVAAVFLIGHQVLTSEEVCWDRRTPASLGVRGVGVFLAFYVPQLVLGVLLASRPRTRASALGAAAVCVSSGVTFFFYVVAMWWRCNVTAGLGIAD